MSEPSRTWGLIGDSQATGLVAPLRDLFEKRGFVLDGYRGEVGWSTARFAATRDAEDVVRGRPAFVLVVLGGNDMPTMALQEKMGIVVSQLRSVEPPPRIIWVGPAHSSVPETQDRKRAVDVFQRAASSRLGFDWIDGGAMTADIPHSQDGIHFSATGSREWARRLDSHIFGTRLLPADAPSRIAAIVGTLSVAGMLGWLGWMIWRK